MSSLCKLSIYIITYLWCLSNVVYAQSTYTTCSSTTHTSTPDLAIPDSASTTHTITIPADSGEICPDSLSITVNIFHTWVGDITINLNNPLSVQLLNRPGFPENSYGCSNDNLEVIFTDLAVNGPLSVGVTCTGTDPAFEGPYLPIEDLSIFNGFDLCMESDWTIFISDEAAGDTGTLTSWSISYCSINNCIVPTSDPTSDPTMQPTQATKAPTNVPTASSDSGDDDDSGGGSAGSGDDGSGDDGSGDDDDDIAAAKALFNNEDEELNGDENDNNNGIISLHFSDETVMNLCILFAVLIVVNIVFCWMCNKRKKGVAKIIDESSTMDNIPI